MSVLCRSLVYCLGSWISVLADIWSNISNRSGWIIMIKNVANVNIIGLITISLSNLDRYLILANFFQFVIPLVYKWKKTNAFCDLHDSKWFIIVANMPAHPQPYSMTVLAFNLSNYTSWEDKGCHVFGIDKSEDNEHPLEWVVKRLNKASSLM